MILRRSSLPVALTAAIVGLAVLPAGAFHLFPLVPGDPGGDCGQTLQADPGNGAGKVTVEYFSFSDQGSGSSTSTVKVSDTVTWTWGNPYCHSVTFQSDAVPGTNGGPPAGRGGEPQLTRPDGDKNSFSVTFPTAGTYEYSCVHHANVGMVGMVVVN